MPMTKTQIVAHLTEKVGATKKQAGMILVEISELAAKAIKKGDKFALPGFVTVLTGLGHDVLTAADEDLLSGPDVEVAACAARRPP